MQITKKRLKEIIAEEMQKLNESGDRYDRGSTHGSWSPDAYYERLIAQIAELMKELKGADPMNWEHNLAAIGKALGSPIPMQEAYTRTKKRK